MSSLEECIESKRCKVTLFEQEGCPYCQELKDKLTDLGIDYDEEDVTKEVLDHFERETVPFARVDDEKTGKQMLIENESIDEIRDKINSTIEDDGDF